DDPVPLLYELIKVTLEAILWSCSILPASPISTVNIPEDRSDVVEADREVVVECFSHIRRPCSIRRPEKNGRAVYPLLNVAVCAGHLIEKVPTSAQVVHQLGMLKGVVGD